MKHIIKFSEAHDADGFYVLMTSGVGTALPGHIYIVEETQLKLLQQRGIPYVEISREGGPPKVTEDILERI